MRLRDGTWETPGAEGVREAAGTQSARTYIERRQATVDHWVALHILFEVCARDTGYDGGGSMSQTWWRQEATEKQLRATLADLQEAKGSRLVGIWARSKNRKGEGGWGVKLE